MLVEQLTEVGGGKHLKLRLSQNGRLLDAIFFSTTACKAAVALGDLVEVAFTPQINEYRGLRTVQLNVTDIRPIEATRQAMEQEKVMYARLVADAITAVEAPMLVPPRNEFAAVWRYLRSHSPEGSLTDEFTVLSRKIARSAGLPVSFVRTKVCLDVLEERGLIEMHVGSRTIDITLTPGPEKVDLQNSAILLRLRKHYER
jgi:single-stranded-DNA-specific exonuclease